MMRRTSLLLAAIALVTASCARDDAGLQDCGDVAEATVVLLRDVITELEGLPPEQQEDLVTEGEFPDDNDFTERRRQLSDRADELDCTDLEVLVSERIPGLVADSSEAVTRLVTGWVQDGEDFFTRLFGEN